MDHRADSRAGTKRLHQVRKSNQLSYFFGWIRLIETF